jgi:hypothetical protein
MFMRYVDALTEAANALFVCIGQYKKNINE